MKSWFQCTPDIPIEHDDWPFDAISFIKQLTEHSVSLGIRVCGVTSKGKVRNEYFLTGGNYYKAQDLLYEMASTTNLNIMFDPVPWADGARQKAVRLGWATIVGAHPFHMHPEPVTFWEVGSHTYQALVPWHEPVPIAKSCERAADCERVLRGVRSVSKPDELLFMPGSIIRKKGMPAFTAKVQYDAFSATELEEPHHFWAEY